MTYRTILYLLLFTGILLMGCDSSKTLYYPPDEGSEPEPGELVKIPAGSFRMGSPPNLFQDNEEPIHSVHLNSYYINKYEVTNQEYAQFLSEIDNPSQHYNVEMEIVPAGDGNYSAKDGFERHPVRYVTWHSANAYAEWFGGRLPTEAEWEMAARGTADERYFPWGNQIYSGQANWFNYDGTWEVGTAEGTSYFGLYDMAGNVWEWVSDWYSATYYYNSPDQNPQGPATGQQKVIRGGGYLTESEYQLRCAVRFAVRPDEAHPDLGFRCVVDTADYEP